MVDVKELIAGLEGQLRQDFIKRMTKTMKRKPSQAEVDEKISEMPGGALLPVEVGDGFTRNATNMLLCMQYGAVRCGAEDAELGWIISRRENCCSAIVRLSGDRFTRRYVHTGTKAAHFVLVEV